MSTVMDGYVSRRDLAAELGVCARTIERWERRRVAPPRTRVGQRVFYSRTAVAAWLEAGGIEGAERRLAEATRTRRRRAAA